MFVVPMGPFFPAVDSFLIVARLPGFDSKSSEESTEIQRNPSNEDTTIRRGRPGGRAGGQGCCAAAPLGAGAGAGAWVKMGCAQISFRMCSYSAETGCDYSSQKINRFGFCVLD